MAQLISIKFESHYNLYNCFIQFLVHFIPYKDTIEKERGKIVFCQKEPTNKKGKGKVNNEMRMGAR